jgi:hypothetical protein
MDDRGMSPEQHGEREIDVPGMAAHRPNGVANASLRSRLLRPALATMLVTFVVLQWAGGKLGQRTVPLAAFQVPVDGMVAFELAGSVDSSRRLLDSWDVGQRVFAGFSLGLDFLFILVYATCFTIGCLWAVEVFVRRNSWLSGPGRLIAWGQVAAGILDAIEDIALLVQLFSAPRAPWPAVAYWCAVLKFGLILVGLVYIAAGAVAKFVGWLHAPARQTPSGSRFDLFLSYGSKNERITLERKPVLVVSELKKALESHPWPRPVATNRFEFFRVCTDIEDFELSETVHSSIRDKLGECDALLVLCSEAAAAESSHVRFELETFRVLRPNESPVAAFLNILPEKAFPDFFRPGSMAANLSYRDDMSRKEWRKRLHGESHKIVAKVWDLPIEEVFNRWRERRRQNQRRVAGAVLVVALILAGMFLWGMNIDAERRNADIARRFAVVERVPITPTSLDQRAKLVALRDEALRGGFEELADKIEASFARIAPEEERVFHLAPDPSRKGVAVNSSGHVLCVASSDRIELYDLNTMGLIKSHDVRHIPNRSFGQLLRMSADAAGDRFIFELAYASFAKPEEAARIKIEGDVTFRFFHGQLKFTVEGNQQEIFAVSPDGSPPSSIGMSKDLKLIKDDEFFPGRYEEEAMTRGEVLREWFDTISWKDALGTARDRSGCVLKALRLLNALSEVVRFYGSNEPASTWASLLMRQQVSNGLPARGYPLGWLAALRSIIANFASALEGQSHHYMDVQSVIEDSYGRAGIYRVVETPDLWAALGPPPRYEHQVFFAKSGRLMRLDPQVNVNREQVGSVIFGPAGRRMFILRKDKSIEDYDLQKRKIAHRFSETNECQMNAVSEAIESVVVLRLNGEVEAWNISTFGPDGWYVSRPKRLDH